jgi:hypothetical protein
LSLKKFTIEVGDDEDFDEDQLERMDFQAIGQVYQIHLNNEIISSYSSYHILHLECYRYVLDFNLLCKSLYNLKFDAFLKHMVVNVDESGKPSFRLLSFHFAFTHHHVCRVVGPQDIRQDGT